MTTVPEPAGLVATQGVIGYDPAIGPMPYDPVRARQLLTAAGAQVIMTRRDRGSPSGGEGLTSDLIYRAMKGNRAHADLFLSIHCNAMPQHNTMSGTETYYWSPQSLDLARALHPQAVAAMGGRDGGIRRRAFAVLHHTAMPSVLIEVGCRIGEGATVGA